MTNTLSKTVSDETLSSIVQIESAGKPTIKAKTSSATGLGQFLNGTWLSVVKRHRPDLLQGRSQDDVLGLRKDPAISLEMLARFTEDNIAIIGQGATDGDIYLAHFAGAGTAKKLFRADPDAPASSCFSAAAIRANRSILEGKSVGEVRAWAERKMKAAGGKGWVAKYAKAKARPAKPKTRPVDDETPVKVEEPYVPLPPARPAQADITAEPIPSDEAPHGMKSGHILLVQKRLKALGYHEVGIIEGEEGGKWGGRTAAAIAAFKNDRGLGGAPLIDEALKAELDEAEAEGWKRPIARERAEAKPEEVAKKIESVEASRSSKFWAFILGIPAMVVSFFKGIVDNFEAALESPILNAVKDFFADNILYIALAVLGVAATIWWKSQKAEKATVDAYREGRLP